MEKLQKRSDGFYETSSGLLGVRPLRHRLESSTYLEFSFKAHPTDPSIVIRWRKEDGIAVIDADVAKTMLNLGYVGHVTEEQAERWNALVEEMQPDALEPQGNEPNGDEPKPAEGEGTIPAAETGSETQGAGTGGTATEQTGEQSEEQEKEAEEASETEQQDAEGSKTSGKGKKGSLV